MRNPAADHRDQTEPNPSHERIHNNNNNTPRQYNNGNNNNVEGIFAVYINVCRSRLLVVIHTRTQTHAQTAKSFHEPLQIRCCTCVQYSNFVRITHTPFIRFESHSLEYLPAAAVYCNVRIRCTGCIPSDANKGGKVYRHRRSCYCSSRLGTVLPVRPW